jgi:antitoxin PrlF
VRKPKVVPVLEYNRESLSEYLVVVTRKGQVTIPVEHRRKYKIREGMKLRVMDSPGGLVLKPLTPIEELAGADAGRISLNEMHRRLDEMRLKDRY